MSRPSAIDQREYKKRGTINTTVVVILSSFNVVRQPGRLSAFETSFFSIPFSEQVRRQKKKTPNKTRNGLFVYFFRCSHRLTNERRETMTDVGHIIIIAIIIIIKA
jgi:hypothetical protein